MPSIIVKFQICGKSNCHCSFGEYHGPYFWFVKYVKPRNSLKKGKYKWQYIGKDSSELNEFLNQPGKKNIKSSITDIINESEKRRRELRHKNNEFHKNNTISFD